MVLRMYLLYGMILIGLGNDIYGSEGHPALGGAPLPHNPHSSLTDSVGASDAMWASMNAPRPQISDFSQQYFGDLHLVGKFRDFVNKSDNASLIEQLAWVLSRENSFSLEEIATTSQTTSSTSSHKKNKELREKQNRVALLLDKLQERLTKADSAKPFTFFEKQSLEETIRSRSFVLHADKLGTLKSTLESWNGTHISARPSTVAALQRGATTLLGGRFPLTTTLQGYSGNMVGSISFKNFAIDYQILYGTEYSREDFVNHLNTKGISDIISHVGGLQEYYGRHPGDFRSELSLAKLAMLFEKINELLAQYQQLSPGNSLLASIGLLNEAIDSLKKNEFFNRYQAILVEIETAAQRIIAKESLSTHDSQSRFDRSTIASPAAVAWDTQSSSPTFSASAANAIELDEFSSNPFGSGSARRTVAPADDDDDDASVSGESDGHEEVDHAPDGNLSVVSGNNVLDLVAQMSPILADSKRKDHQSDVLTDLAFQSPAPDVHGRGSPDGVMKTLTFDESPAPATSTLAMAHVDDARAKRSFPLTPAARSMLASHSSRADDVQSDKGSNIDDGSSASSWGDDDEASVDHQRVDTTVGGEVLLSPSQSLDETGSPIYPNGDRQTGSAVQRSAPSGEQFHERGVTFAVSTTTSSGDGFSARRGAYVFTVDEVDAIGSSTSSTRDRAAGKEFQRSTTFGEQSNAQRSTPPGQFQGRAATDGYRVRRGAYVADLDGVVDGTESPSASARERAAEKRSQMPPVSGTQQGVSESSFQAHQPDALRTRSSFGGSHGDSSHKENGQGTGGDSALRGTSKKSVHSPDQLKIPAGTPKINKKKLPNPTKVPLTHQNKKGGLGIVRPVIGIATVGTIFYLYNKYYGDHNGAHSFIA